MTPEEFLHKAEAALNSDNDAVIADALNDAFFHMDSILAAVKKSDWARRTMLGEMLDTIECANR